MRYIVGKTVLLSGVSTSENIFDSQTAPDGLTSVIIKNLGSAGADAGKLYVMPVSSNLSSDATTFNEASDTQNLFELDFGATLEYMCDKNTQIHIAAAAALDVMVQYKVGIKV